MEYYKNNKTGKVYAVSQYKIINATNDMDGQIMVGYTDGADGFFVRETEDFYKKFTKTEDPT